MSHTKGEWRATPINTIINAKTKKVIARLARGGRSQKELTANARLIAAAPDLLTACCNAQGDYEALKLAGLDKQLPGYAQCLKFLEDTIAKAHKEKI